MAEPRGRGGRKLMVAYSFQRQFVDPILSGRKQQTIRAPRIGRSRHARPGEQLQLYVGMRTRHCRLVGRAKAFRVRAIEVALHALDPALDFVDLAATTGAMAVQHRADWLDLFAVSDGFASWAEMRAFWLRHNVPPEFGKPDGPFPNGAVWDGVLIEWRRFEPGATFSTAAAPMMEGADG
ncbi:hypothetical protein ACFOGJ_09070 [Marinibaculum pumilum]|uniref:ASCH domain-containing protein n=1 Tax=Marinibaculum pumilum TaxID=1766165 RepID=A0ABV7KYV7_9PROT